MKLTYKETLMQNALARLNALPNVYPAHFFSECNNIIFSTMDCYKYIIFSLSKDDEVVFNIRDIFDDVHYHEIKDLISQMDKFSGMLRFLKKNPEVFAIIREYHHQINDFINSFKK